MRLSVCMLTKDSAGYVGDVLRAARSFADEVVVAVDDATTDHTEEICREYADKVYRVETPGHIGPVLAWLNGRCSGAWILRLDDDELPSREFVEALPDLLEDKDFTHYWLRRRWVTEDGARWIPEHPWWPDWQLRLFRNIPSIVNVPGKAHTSYVVQGAGRYLYEGSIYHYDFAYHDRSERARKVEHRESIEAGKGFDRVYLPDYSSISTENIPARDAPLDPSKSPPPRKPEKSSPGFGERIRSIVAPSPRKVGADEIRLSMFHGRKLDHRVCKARVKSKASPRSMRAGEWHPVDVELRNDSHVAWPLPGLGSPNVRLGHHWFQKNGELYEYEGHRTAPPQTLWPGQAVTFPVSVRAPEELGDYVLRWDPIIEDEDPQGMTAWFSAHGWRCPEIKVKVE